MISTLNADRQIGALAQRVTLLGATSDGATVGVRPGIRASVIRAAPHLAAVNFVVYNDPASLRNHLPDITATYDRAGISSTRVWVPDWFAPQFTEPLEPAGYRPRAWHAAMLLNLDLYLPRDPGELEWDVGTDLPTLAEINQTADPANADGLPAALHHLAEASAARVYRAHLDGRVVAALCALDHYRDVSLAWVATLPHARRLFITSALVTVALNEAKARGCTSSSIQANPDSLLFFTRLGYRTLAGFTTWDRRHDT